MRAPTTDEFTLAVGRQFGGRGGIKARYQWRSISGLIEHFIDDPSASGKITIVTDGVNLGTFDRVVWRNSDQPVRTYQALVFQADQRLYARASGVAQTLYFGERGVERFSGWSQVDLAVLYQIPYVPPCDRS